METLEERNEKYIRHIMSQTNYSETEAREKFKDFNYDFMKVLKDYMGIPEKKENTHIKSVNQEIYKQIRHTLDNSMKEYREKHPVDLNQIITNFQESDEREKLKIKN